METKKLKNLVLAN